MTAHLDQSNQERSMSIRLYLHYSSHADERAIKMSPTEDTWQHSTVPAYSYIKVSWPAKMLTQRDPLSSKYHHPGRTGRPPAWVWPVNAFGNLIDAEPAALRKC